MTNETFWILKKIIETKIHKYKNIVYLISLHSNAYNSWNHSSKLWGCKILWVHVILDSFDNDYI
jgi:hypothetical protein